MMADVRGPPSNYGIAARSAFGVWFSHGFDIPRRGVPLRLKIVGFLFWIVEETSVAAWSKRTLRAGPPKLYQNVCSRSSIFGTIQRHKPVKARQKGHQVPGDMPDLLPFPGKRALSELHFLGCLWRHTGTSSFASRSPHSKSCPGWYSFLPWPRLYL
jgi:hypothetical protein